jgi:hypothetical protein
MDASGLTIDRAGAANANPADLQQGITCHPFDQVAQTAQTILRPLGRLGRNGLPLENSRCFSIHQRRAHARAADVYADDAARGRHSVVVTFVM